MLKTWIQFKEIKRFFLQKILKIKSKFTASSYFYLILKKVIISPGRVVQLVGASFHTPKGCRSIPGQDTYLGWGSDLQSGCIWETTD